MNHFMQQRIVDFAQATLVEQSHVQRYPWELVFTSRTYTSAVCGQVQNDRQRWELTGEELGVQSSKGIVRIRAGLAPKDRRGLTVTYA